MRLWLCLWPWLCTGLLDTYEVYDKAFEKDWGRLVAKDRFRRLLPTKHERSKVGVGRLRVHAIVVQCRRRAHQRAV